MTDYKKAEQAKKLLEESGVPYMLAYSKDNTRVSSRVNGQYPTIKNFIITAMSQAIKDVHNQCGGGMATSEVIEITRVVLERLRAEEEQKTKENDHE